MQQNLRALPAHQVANITPPLPHLTAPDIDESVASLSAHGFLPLVANQWCITFCWCRRKITSELTLES